MYTIQWLNECELMDSQTAETAAELAAILVRWLNARTPLPGERIVITQE